MQIRSEVKRARICRAAAALFSARPYHEVLLSDVAAAAGVGKGTIYVYFPSKEALYLGIHVEELARLVKRLEDLVERTTDPEERLSEVVRAIAHHLFENPQLLDVVRHLEAPAKRAPFRQQHARMVALIERVIRSGIEAGRFADPRPELTAVCVPGLVRSALLHGPRDLGADEAGDHLIGLLLSGLSTR